MLWLMLSYDLCYDLYYAMTYAMLCLMLCYALCYAMTYAILWLMLWLILCYALCYAMPYAMLCIMLWLMPYAMFGHGVLRSWIKGPYRWCRSGCRDPSPSHPRASPAGRPRGRRRTPCVWLDRCRTQPSPLWATLTFAHWEAADIQRWVSINTNCCTQSLGFFQQLSTTWPVLHLHLCVYFSNIFGCSELRRCL